MIPFNSFHVLIIYLVYNCIKKLIYTIIIKNSHKDHFMYLFFKSIALDLF